MTQKVIGPRVGPRTFRVLANLLFRPHRNAGVRITRISDDWLEWDLKLRMSLKTRNYVGTHWGGTLYSAADSHFMLAWLNILGPEYIVWDKGATVRFRRPGRGTLTGRVRIPPNHPDMVRERLETEEKFDLTYPFEWVDKDGTVVAEVEKVLHFRKKR